MAQLPPLSPEGPHQGARPCGARTSGQHVPALPPPVTQPPGLCWTLCAGSVRGRGCQQLTDVHARECERSSAPSPCCSGSPETRPPPSLPTPPLDSPTEPRPPPARWGPLSSSARSGVAQRLARRSARGHRCPWQLQRQALAPESRSPGHVGPSWGGSREQGLGLDLSRQRGLGGVEGGSPP